MAVRLFVGNLAYSTTEADLRTYFGTVAPPSQVVLPVDRETGRPRGLRLHRVHRSRACRAGDPALQRPALQWTPARRQRGPRPRRPRARGAAQARRLPPGSTRPRGGVSPRVRRGGSFGGPARPLRRRRQLRAGQARRAIVHPQLRPGREASALGGQSRRAREKGERTSRAGPDPARRTPAVALLQPRRRSHTPDERAAGTMSTTSRPQQAETTSTKTRQTEHDGRATCRKCPLRSHGGIGVLAWRRMVTIWDQVLEKLRAGMPGGRFPPLVRGDRVRQRLRRSNHRVGAERGDPAAPRQQRTRTRSPARLRRWGRSRTHVRLVVSGFEDDEVG